VISASKQPISNRISRKAGDILDMDYPKGLPLRRENLKGRSKQNGFAIQNLAPLHMNRHRLQLLSVRAQLSVPPANR
jgi:hypothetical protein